MLAIVIVGIIVSLILVFYVYYKQKFSYWRSRGIPHDAPTFLFGNVLDILFAGDTGKYAINLFKKYNSDYIGFYGLTKPILFIKDLNLIEHMLTKKFSAFCNRNFAYNPQIEIIISRSLVGAQNSEWRRLRRQLSPVFTTRRIKMMMHLMMKCGQNLENYLENMSDKIIDMKKIATKYTTDVIFSCGFGMNMNSFLNESSEVEKYAQRFYPTSIWGSLRKISYIFAPGLITAFRYSFYETEATTYFKKVFTEIINLRKKNRLERDDFIKPLLDIEEQSDELDHFSYDEDKLLGHAIMFFIAGFDTTSSTIAMTLHELSNNHHIQNRLRNEIKTEIDKHGGLTYESVQNMKYLHMVISETLRKYPPASFVTRDCTEEFRIENTGLVIEKGTSVIISQHSLHWDPKYFPNPETYDPERFSQENIHKIRNFTYLPFGFGPRMCIGDRFALLMAKLGLIYIIKSFCLMQDLKDKKGLEFVRALVIQPKNGICMRCIKTEV